MGLARRHTAPPAAFAASHAARPAPRTACPARSSVRRPTAFVAAHPNEPRRVFCTYTAMMALRRTLAQRLGLPEFGEEVSA